jgi:DNA invertase Pin-like site-specific DNA recombinase
MLYHPHFKDEVILEMIIMETQAKIRLLFNIKKHSTSQISRELHLSLNTVKRILRQEKTSYQYRDEFFNKPDRFWTHQKHLSEKYIDNL